MVLEGWMVASAISILGWAAAWGDMRAQVKINRERQDERHEENQHKLREILTDVRKINGQVREHSVKIDNIHHEQERLRDG